MDIASVYFPKWNENRPLGEDGHFVVCEAQNAFGVADGVGSWAKKGIDAGVYSRQLMTNSAAAVRRGVTDPLAVLRRAYAFSKAAQGTSTACVGVLLGHRVLRVANVGDSGLWIFRDNLCTFQSPIQQHGFNRPFQLGNDAEKSNRPSDAKGIEYVMEPGDIIVMGTDGLLDNVHPYEIEDLLRFTQEEQIQLDAHQLAYQIAGIALANSEDEHFCSPFQLAARDAGYLYRGGKIDDITVIVALIPPQI